MWEALEAVALLWTATILVYAVIAARWALNRIRQAAHEGALLHSAQEQPH
jgi:hypothetical protein